MNKKLYRDEYRKMIGGVCAGLAEYFEMDITVVRLLFAFAFFVMGVGFGTYIVLWIVLPRKGYPFNNFANRPGNVTVDYTVPQPGQFNSPVPPPVPPGGRYGANQFGGDPWGNTSFTPPPVMPMPPKQKSHAGIIFGVVLIFIGAAILVDEYDLIPDFDFGQLWPLVLVLVGGALIVSGQKTYPWDKKDWSEPEAAPEPAPVQDETTSTDSSSTTV